MSDHSDLAAAAHDVLDQMRAQGAELDGSDDSLWFVQGALGAMAQEPPGDRASRQFAFSVYIAELLAASCDGVRAQIESGGSAVREVSAVRGDGLTQYVLSWVRTCAADPNADNIVCRFAGALRDFGEHDRAARLGEQLREFTESGYRF